MATTKAAQAAYTQEQARKFYETMSTIRHFEESIKHDGGYH